MQLVETNLDTKHPLERIVGVPLAVVFADGNAIDTMRTRGAGTLRLEPPYHIAEGDAYLVLPEDIGVELVDIMRDSDLDLMLESMRDGLVCFGTVSTSESTPRVVELEVASSITPEEALASGLAYASEVVVGTGTDPLKDIRALGHMRCTLVSELFDDEGLDRALREPEHVGTSWRPSSEKRGADPTFAWTRRIAPGKVGVELALFLEYEEMVVLLRPLALVAS